MILRGTVLRVDTVQGTNDGQAYSYLRAHILDGVDVHQAKVSDRWPGAPVIQGEDILAEVAVTPYSRQGSARLSITLLRPVTLDALTSV